MSIKNNILILIRIVSKYISILRCEKVYLLTLTNLSIAFLLSHKKKPDRYLKQTPLR